MRPTFSIVVSNYNYGHLVAEGIESALNQEFPTGDFDVIVVDDGSTDDSRSVIERYANRPGFRAIYQDNRGQAAALETGVRASTAQYVCFLDSDDLCLPNKLAAVARHIESRSGPSEEVFLCHDLSIVDMRTPGQVRTLKRTWLQTMGADRYGNSIEPPRIDRLFPFANPSGQVFGRTLISDILAALPPWAFTHGPDTAMCLAAALRSWRVDYLHEPLGIYRVHGSNEVGNIVNDEYVVKLRWRDRSPRLLSFLERWVDSLDLVPSERFKRTSLLRHLERARRCVSPSRSLSIPKVSVALLGLCADRIALSSESVHRQHHPAIELLIPSGCVNGAGISGNSCTVVYPSSRAAREFDQLAAAYARAQGDYIVFIRAGDRLDPEFVDQHLMWRQHGALVGLSCSDIRLCGPNGALIHADVYANSGAWPQRLQSVPPLATQLNDWVVSSVSACMFRRTAFLDRLFAHAGTLPDALREAGIWLPVHLQHHTAGILRIRETLSTTVIEDGAAATYGYLSSPAAPDGRLMRPPIAPAKTWLSQFYDEERSLFDARLPPAWHVRFRQWLQVADGARG